MILFYTLIHLFGQGKRPDWADEINSSPIVLLFIFFGLVIFFSFFLNLKFSNKKDIPKELEKTKTADSTNIDKEETIKKIKKTRKKINTEKENLPGNQKDKLPTVDLNEVKWNANGSGFFISRDGYIATNSHVVKSDEYLVNNIAVEFNYKNEIRIFKSRIIRTDDQNDLAIIKIEDENFKSLQSIPYSLREDDAELGEEVFALGYPMALTLMGTDIKFTDGRISSKTGFKGNVSTYQSTTPIQPGNSGGPLFDYDGNLLGINSSGLSKGIVDNVAYTIKSSYLKNLVNVLPKKILFKKQNKLAGLNTSEKIKVLSKVVVLIKVELIKPPKM
jgi:S1-C subfamily serine protease